MAKIGTQLREYFENQGITQKYIAEKLGVKPPYITKILNGEREIGKNQADKWVSLFGFSKAWLLTGEGEMLNSSKSHKEEPSVPVISYTSGRPYYNIDFIGGFDMVFCDSPITPEYNIDFAPYNRDGVVWCNITGNSMSPRISHGDIIAIKEVVDWQNFLIMGEIYALVTTTDLRTVKIIRKGSDSTKFRLVPVNKEEYDEQEISKSLILRIFEVVGCMKRI
jgi:hypothetical protein